jgi:transcriptional regulator with XRE-family HTH domain
MHPNEIDAHVGQRMRSLRESLGLSQERLGQQLGLTFSQVQKYERGANRIGAGHIFIIASLLNVPVPYFFEDLAGGPKKGAHGCTPSMSGTESREFKEAFLSIPCDSARRSLAALVQSLANPNGRVPEKDAVDG